MKFDNDEIDLLIEALDIAASSLEAMDMHEDRARAMRRLRFVMLVASGIMDDRAA